MNLQEKVITFAKLRLLGDDLNPEEITEILREQPTYSSVARELVMHPAIPGNHMTGIWDLESIGRVISPDPEAHIEWLISLLDRTGYLALDLPGVEGAEMSCSWSWFPPLGHPRTPAGPSFSVAVLESLVRHGLILTVNRIPDSATFDRNRLTV